MGCLALTVQILTSRTNNKLKKQYLGKDINLRVRCGSGQNVEIYIRKKLGRANSLYECSYIGMYD
jgi:hypothetical protein